jgi:hypothetical protein
VVKKGWKWLDIPIGPYDRDVRFTVTKGPPGSTPDFDFTFVGLSFWGPKLSLAALGKASFILVLGALLLSP